MTKTGAEIDKNVALGERREPEQVEDMACRCGLIEDHAVRRMRGRRIGCFEPKHCADDLVEGVEAQTTSGDSIGLKPLRKKGRPGSLLNFCANGLAEFIVHRFEVCANRDETRHTLLVHEPRIRRRRRTVSEQGVKAVEEFEALAQLRWLEERSFLFKLLRQSLVDFDCETPRTTVAAGPDPDSEGILQLGWHGAARWRNALPHSFSADFVVVAY